MTGKSADIRSYTTAVETAAEFGVSIGGLNDYIRDGLINPPSRYINGLPEWDKPVSWNKRSRAGKVYLAGFSHYVKIGFTSAAKIEYRLAEVQTGCPEKLIVYAVVDGTCATEAALHRRFSDLRTYGEWFRRQGDLDAWIKAGCP